MYTVNPAADPSIIPAKIYCNAVGDVDCILLLDDLFCSSASLFLFDVEVVREEGNSMVIISSLIPLLCCTNIIADFKNNNPAGLHAAQKKGGTGVVTCGILVKMEPTTEFGALRS